MLIDLCLSENQAYKHKFDKLVYKISLGTDRLRNNYQDISLQNFICLTLIVDEESKEILAFSGLQKRPDRWGDHTARILSRYYIVPGWRNRYSMFEPINIFGFKMFSFQLQAAVTSGLSNIFISRDNHPRAFAEFIKLLNTQFQINLELLPGRYRVCGPKSSNPACVQYVAKLELGPNRATFNLPRAQI